LLPHRFLRGSTDSIRPGLFRRDFSMGLSSSEVAVPRVNDFNPARGIRGNNLDSDSSRLNIALVSEDVYVIASWVDKPHSCFVHMRLAAGIVAFIFRHCPSGDDDQAMARVRVPAAASAGRKDIVLDVHV